MKWRVIPLQTYSAIENMAIDEMLLQTSREPTLRFYQFSQPSVTLGYQQDVSIVGRGHVSSEDVVMRITGGNAVYHGVRDLTYSICAPVSLFSSTGKPLHDTYDKIRQWLTSSLNSLDGVTALSFGKNDIVSSDNKKICGNAIKLNHQTQYVLIHGSLFLSSTPEQWAVSLDVPLNQLQKKLGRIANYTTPKDLLSRILTSLNDRFLELDMVSSTYTRDNSEEEQQTINSILDHKKEHTPFTLGAQKQGTACAIDIVDDSQEEESS